MPSTPRKMSEKVVYVVSYMVGAVRNPRIMRMCATPGSCVCARV
jgi:hypothetical protein